MASHIVLQQRLQTRSCKLRPATDVLCGGKHIWFDAPSVFADMLLQANSFVAAVCYGQAHTTMGLEGRRRGRGNCKVPSRCVHVMVVCIANRLCW